jgi:hypothetical protein
VRRTDVYQSSLTAQCGRQTDVNQSEPTVLSGSLLCGGQTDGYQSVPMSMSGHQTGFQSVPT